MPLSVRTVTDFPRRLSSLSRAEGAPSAAPRPESQTHSLSGRPQLAQRRPGRVHAVDGAEREADPHEHLAGQPDAAIRECREREADEQRAARRDGERKLGVIFGESADDVHRVCKLEDAF